MAVAHDLTWAKQMLSDEKKRHDACERAFADADEDGSGALDVDEVAHLIWSMCNEMHIKVPEMLKIKELIKFVRKADKNHDDVLELGEFRTAFKTVLKNVVAEAEKEAREAEEAAKAQKAQEEAEAAKKAAEDAAEEAREAKEAQEAADAAKKAKEAEETRKLKEAQEAAAAAAKQKEEAEEAAEAKQKEKELQDMDNSILNKENQSSNVTDEMVSQKMKEGLTETLRQRVETRAYFLWLNGSKASSEAHFLAALRTELELAADEHPGTAAGYSN